MSLYPTPHDDLTCPNAREVAALRKRVEELERDVRVHDVGRWLSSCTPAERSEVAFYADVEGFKARAEKAERELFRAIPIYEEALTLARERAGKAEARVAAYEDALSREMPTDMKDWWENSKEEWPEVARWVLEQRRLRTEKAEAERDRALDSLASYQASAHNYVLKQQENAKLQADLDAAQERAEEAEKRMEEWRRWTDGAWRIPD